MLTYEILVKTIAGVPLMAALFILAGWLSFRAGRFAFHNDAEKLFWFSFVGMLQVVSLYAIIKTSFQTILLPVPVLTLLLIIRKQVSNEAGVSWKFHRNAMWLLVLCALSASILFFIQAFIPADPRSIRFGGGDYSYYARAATYLNLLGKENNTLEFIFHDRFTVTPYHYGDLWLTALASWMLQLNASMTLILVIYPFLAFQFIIGLAGYLIKRFRSDNHGNIYWVFIAVLSIFIPGLRIFFPESLLNADVFIGPVSNYPKILWVGSFLVASFYLARANDLNSLLILSAVAGLSFINVFPTFLGGIVLWYAVMKLRKARFEKYNMGIIALLASLLFIYLFYKYFSVTDSASMDTGLGLRSYLNPAQLKTAVNILAGGFFQFSILIPFFILAVMAGLVVYRSPKLLLNFASSNELVWGIMLSISGLLCWGVFFPLTNESVQFFHNVFISLIAILCTILVFWCLIRFQHLVLKIATVIFIVYVSNYGFNWHLIDMDRQEWQLVKAYFKGADKVRFATLDHDDKFQTFFSKNTRLFQAVPALNYLYDPYVNESLNAPFIKLDSSAYYKDIEKKIISLASFDYYVKKKTVGAPEAGKDALMQSFIADNNIDYVIVSAAVSQPLTFLPFIKDSLILPKERYRIYRVK